MGGLSGVLIPDGFRQHLVHRTRSVSLEVECNIGETEPFHLRHKLFTKRLLEEPGYFLGADFNPGSSVVVKPDAEGPEAAVTQKCFSAVDTRKVLRIDTRAIRETR